MKRAKFQNRLKQIVFITTALFFTQIMYGQEVVEDNQEETDTTVAEEIVEEETAPAEDEVATTEEVVVLVPDASSGKAYFQGEKRFAEGGPACVVCHNVNAEGVIPGGLFAKDLTDVYERLGDGLVGWLMAPPFPAMASSYTDHPLTEQERTDLTAFFKEAYENKPKNEEEVADKGAELFYFGGGLGLLIILGLVQVLWMKRKRKMTKQDIFKRQSKAWDAKF